MTQISSWGKGGALVGLVLSVVFIMTQPSALRQYSSYPSIRPHTVPVEQSGIALRWAMVYDILHERYPQHSEAWYRARNEVVRKKLTELQDGPERWHLLDDLAMGLERLGENVEAEAILQEKLTTIRTYYPKFEIPPSDEALATYQPRQIEWMQAANTPPQNPAALHLYKTYANLGTTLIHRGLIERKNGASGIEAITEGEAHIRQSIALNPGAHFGREAWQAAAVRFLSAGFAEPELFTQFDITGKPWVNSENYPSSAHREIPRAQHKREQAPLDKRYYWRRAIPFYIPDSEWSEHTGLSSAIPFDQPLLGIMGMWRYGGGPNPHFALAMGNALRDAGQERLAWAAFERTRSMLDKFHPNEVIRQDLRAYLDEQQTALEEEIGETADVLGDNHRISLAQGLAWQEARKAYEEQQLDLGASVDDPDFFAQFEQSHGPITSPVGTVEFTILRKHQSDSLYAILLIFAGVIFAAGVGIWLGLWRSRSLS